MRGRKTGGRRKGTPNKVTAEARAVCAAILDGLIPVLSLSGTPEPSPLNRPPLSRVVVASEPSRAFTGKG